MRQHVAARPFDPEPREESGAVLARPLPPHHIRLLSDAGPRIDVHSVARQPTGGLGTRVDGTVTGLVRPRGPTLDRDFTVANLQKRS